MEKKTGYDAVVFDMDGVIFDSERAVMQCWKELADKYQIPDIEKAVLSCTGTTMKRTREIMLEIYGEDFPYDIYAKESSAIYHSRYDGGRLPMKPGVVELLTFLKEDGKKIALASSTRRQTVTNQLKDAGILNFFDNVICGDMVEHSKPAPDIFLKACAELGVAPERAYAIEDSYNGIRAAHAGHLLPIMVPDLLPANEEMQEKGGGYFHWLCAFVLYTGILFGRSRVGNCIRRDARLWQFSDSGRHYTLWNLRYPCDLGVYGFCQPSDL